MSQQNSHNIPYTGQKVRLWQLKEFLQRERGLEHGKEPSFQKAKDILEVSNINKKPWTGPKASSGRLEQLGLFQRVGNG